MKAGAPKERQPASFRDAKGLQATTRDKTRFWRRVSKEPGGCWCFDAVTQKGYATFHVNGVQIRAHRLAKLWDGGPPAKSKLIACHKCNNRRCVNPAHIYWGTNAENMADMVNGGNHVSETRQGHFNKRAVLTPSVVAYCWKQFHQEGERTVNLAKELDISPSTLFGMLRRRHYRNLTDKLVLQIPERSVDRRFGAERYDPRRKLVSAKVKVIREKLHQGESRASLARRFFVSKSCIADVATNKTWTSVQD